MYTEGITPYARMGTNDYGDGCGCEAEKRPKDVCEICEEVRIEPRDGTGGCVCEYTKRGGCKTNSIGMVYAPVQSFDNVYDLDTALKRGTVFAELALPFLCGGKKKGGCCDD